MRIRRTMVVVSLGVVVGGTAASAAVLCKNKKTGALAIATTACSKKQIQVELTSGGLAVTATSLAVTSAPFATNAATVGGYAPAQLVRAMGSSGSATISSTNGGAENLITQVTIKAPGPGLLVASTNLQVAGGAGCPCGYWVRLRNVTTFQPSPEWSVVLVDASGEYSSASNHWVFPVTAAGDNTIIEEAYRNTGTFNSTGFGQLTVVFVPFDGTGAVPTP